MKHILIIAGLLLGLLNNVSAYPISPRPLRQLVIESPYIIVGYVADVQEREESDDDRGSRVARIAVMEHLQGQIGKDTIELSFSPNMICPAPDRYFKGTYVLSFIDKDKNGKLYTHALSYGSKTLSMEEIRIYKARITEMQQILNIKDSVKQFKATVEWLVTCAEAAATRWEGSFELSPQSDFMSGYSQGTQKDYQRILTQGQKSRLKRSLLASGELPDFGLVDLVYKGNEAEIDRFLLSGLKALQEGQYWMADEFMDRLAHKGDPAQMKSLKQEFNRIQFEDKKDKELKDIIDQFVRLVEKP